jgi:hypothetical protein
MYCSYKEQKDQTALNLLASLLQQLVQKNGGISNDIWALYQRHTKEQTRPTIAEWSKLLQSEVRHFQKVFIVIDGLDECSETNGTRWALLTEIQKLKCVHLLVTSRYIPTFEHEFRRAARLEIRASDEDVRRYVTDRIKRERRLARHVEEDPSLKETIINGVAEKAQGM